jgi:uncharacterized protein with HEPN domain
MRDAAIEAVAFSSGKSRQDLEQDRMLALALVRELEIIGEAAARVTPELRARHEALPWAEMVAMRNRLIHGYFDVDLDVLWTTIRDDLPPLIEATKSIITSIESS